MSTEPNCDGRLRTLENILENDGDYRDGLGFLRNVSLEGLPPRKLARLARFLQVKKQPVKYFFLRIIAYLSKEAQEDLIEDLVKESGTSMNDIAEILSDGAASSVRDAIVSELLANEQVRNHVHTHMYRLYSVAAKLSESTQKKLHHMLVTWPRRIGGDDLVMVYVNDNNKEYRGAILNVLAELGDYERIANFIHRASDVLSDSEKVGLTKAMIRWTYDTGIIGQVVQSDRTSQQEFIRHAGGFLADKQLLLLANAMGRKE